MSGAWARPVEQLLGVALDRNLTEEALQALVDDRVPEGDQIDFKVARYARSEDGREELAKDVCAFANRRGGVLVIGIAEDNGVASKLKPLDGIADRDARRIRSVVASWCAPLPDIDVLLVRSDHESRHGYIVIVVPPSTRAPHAVTPPRGNSFMWPVRHGSQTDWLSESELADAYRTRASRVADEGRRLQQVLEEAVRQFESKDPWLVCALVPAGSRPADPIDRLLVTQYTEWFRQAERTVPNGYGSIGQGHAVAGQRRVVLRYNPTPGKPIAGAFAELHTDGTALLAWQIPQRRGQSSWGLDEADDLTRLIYEEVVAEFALTHLLLMCRHAIDNGGAWGEATATMVLTDGGRLHLREPVALSAARNVFPDRLGGEIVDGEARQSTITVDIGAVTGNGREAVIAARLLGGGLVNVFGWPELSQYTAEGHVRAGQFGTHNRETIKRWADPNGVSIDT